MTQNDLSIFLAQLDQCREVLDRFRRDGRAAILRAKLNKLIMDAEVMQAFDDAYAPSGS